ncbi:MAG: NAD(+)/NADH kinase [Actinobacteria bacterium]|jgi:NAD+ kinase|nr:MAG: NAD(+)/NADH kinase [Actinomycetota bacterium]
MTDTAMRRVGIVVNESREAAQLSADELASWLQAAGHEVRRPAPWVTRDEGFASGLDLVVSLGGDGSILRSVALVGDHGVPILGVNFGQLGYLTLVEPDEAKNAIERFFAGDFDIEERMLLDVYVHAPGTELDGSVHHALNEVTLERPVTLSTLRLSVCFDDTFFTTYAADGLIVATPTGSTGYAFSVRAPIVDATHRALLLTPISPHMLFDRSLILAPTTRVQVTVSSHRPASLSVDGRSLGVLRDDDSITCSASSRVARLITFGPRDFHAVLKAKFGLNDR